MPIYAFTEITAISQCTNIPANKLARIRGADISIIGVSLAAPSLFGRNRGKVLPSITSKAFSDSQSNLRIRHAEAAASASSVAICTKPTTIPATQMPIGQLFLDGQSIQNAILIKGGSYSFGFNIFGKKLLNLTIVFILENLRGETLIQKQMKLDPGGIAIDDYSIDPDGNESISGYIVLLPQDTKFIDSETKFTLELKNQHTRRYFLEKGFLFFNDNFYGS